MASTGRLSLLNAEAIAAEETTSASVSLQNSHVDLVAALIVADNEADTLDVSIEHSPDGENWFELVAFTQITTASASELKPILPATMPALGHVRALVEAVGADTIATVSLSLHYRDAR